MRRPSSEDLILCFFNLTPLTRGHFFGQIWGDTILFVVGEDVEAEVDIVGAEIFQVKIADGVPGSGGDGADVVDFFFPGVGGVDGDIPGLFGSGGFAHAELKNIGAGGAGLDPDTNMTIKGEVKGCGHGSSDSDVSVAGGGKDVVV